MVAFVDEEGVPVIWQCKPSDKKTEAGEVLQRRVVREEQVKGGVGGRGSKFCRVCMARTRTVDCNMGYEDS